MTKLVAPRSADTPEKRVRYWARGWRKLHEWHETERIARQGKAPSPQELDAWFRWERGTWIPAMKVLGVPFCAAREEMVEALPPTFAEDRPEMDLRDEIVGEAKRVGSEEAKWDADLPDVTRLVEPRDVQLPPDPDEDFTTYTEVDPNGRITVIASKVSWAGLARNEDAYVHKDHGVNHFDGDFEHRLELYVTAAEVGSNAAQWNLTNIVDDRKGIRDAGGDYLSYSHGADAVGLFTCLQESDGGTPYGDCDGGLTNIGTLYYCTPERDEAVGAFGTAYVYIRTGSHAGALIDTLSVALHTSKKDYRHVIVAQTFNDGNAPVATGYTQNLDLQEAAASPLLKMQRCQVI